jgi:quercetin dioxygenase-like cupin family protein
MLRIFTCLTLSVSVCHFSQAQVQVSEEPRHHKVFENAYVRILDVHIPPGDTSQWHKHSTPSVFLILSNTKTGSEVKVEPGKPSFADGNIWFEGFYDTPRIHRVWNADDHEFHVIDMELPHQANLMLEPPLEGGAFQLLFDEKPVRGYRVTLPGRKDLQIGMRKAPVVVVCLADDLNVKAYRGKLRHRGDYVFVPAGRNLVLRNGGDGDAKLALMELK